MFILALSFTGGPTPTNQATSNNTDALQSLFSGENALRGFIETDEGIIFNPIYRNAAGPADNPTNSPSSPSSESVFDYFDSDDGAPDPDPNASWYYYYDASDPEKIPGVTEFKRRIVNKQTLPSISRKPNIGKRPNP